MGARHLCRLKFKTAPVIYGGQRAGILNELKTTDSKKMTFRDRWLHRICVLVSMAQLLQILLFS